METMYALRSPKGTTSTIRRSSTSQIMMTSCKRPKRIIDEHTRYMKETDREIWAL